MGRMSTRSITEADAANELMRLAREIAKHNKLYHAEDAPEISDPEFDALVRRNAELEEAFPHLVREDSPSKVIGHEIAASPLSKVTHEVRMMSLDNAFSAEEVEEWVARVRRFLSLDESEPVAITAEDKIDGLSCSLRYESGKLVRAATRGDGQVGEDVTPNVAHISDIPQQLSGDVPEVFEIRGEVYMSKADFHALNAAQEKAGGKLFANPRNAAAAQILGAWLGRGLRCTRCHAARGSAQDREVGSAGLAAIHRRSGRRRNAGALRQHRFAASRPSV